jgi:NAD(P)-dependent dehydrogenase (short-subunit alcohol dehydrogenase family)
VRSALITGASTGIGRTAALLLDSKGWRVFAGVRRDEDGRSLREASSERLVPVRIDVTDPASITAGAAAVDAELGTGGLDGLVNNAGIAVPGPLETLPISDFRLQIDINLIGQVEVTQAMLPAIRRATGRIVFVSSVGGRTALPFTGAYHASKFGIEAVGDSLRQELRPWGIHVSLVEPGSVATPIWEKGEGAADEISARAPEQHDRLYGKTIERYRETVRKVAARGVPPEQVAEVIEHALIAPKPKTRYLVGREAKIQARLGKVLPDRVFDRLIAREMGL